LRSEANRREILSKVKNLRVTDMRDGMDWMGLHKLGTVSPDIRPLWRGARAAGFARTCRHIPTQQTVPTMTPEEYTKWAYEHWYGDWGKASKALSESIVYGDFLAVDTCGTQTPAIGSMDSMVWAYRGVRGVVTNGGCRDTDEQIYQKVMPAWSRWVVQPMYQGRVEFGGHDMPIEIGGQLIRPGDLIVADGDGVLVVPDEVVEGVVKWAIHESEGDKLYRKAFFQIHGVPLNESVEPVFVNEPHTLIDQKMVDEMIKSLGPKVDRD
jgi:4-hydroxy-4-methyl-2-oxoglutarate aldolase